MIAMNIIHMLNFVSMDYITSFVKLVTLIKSKTFRISISRSHFTKSRLNMSQYYKSGILSDDKTHDANLGLTKRTNTAIRQILCIFKRNRC